MKYVRRTSKDITRNFLHELLLDRKIINEDQEYVEKYFNPTVGNLLPNKNLDHMEEAYEILMKNIKNSSNIFLIVD